MQITAARSVGFSMNDRILIRCLSVLWNWTNIEWIVISFESIKQELFSGTLTIFLSFSTYINKKLMYFVGCNRPDRGTKKMKEWLTKCRLSRNFFEQLRFFGEILHGYLGSSHRSHFSTECVGFWDIIIYCISIKLSSPNPARIRPLSIAISLVHCWTYIATLPASYVIIGFKSNTFVLRYMWFIDTPCLQP